MPYTILPHLLLGDEEDARNAPTSTKLIVNCTKHIPFYSEDANKYRIPVDDNGTDTDKIAAFWTQELFDDISNHISEGKDVLVHCQMGRQRSAATIAAYIMKAMDWPLTKTIEHMRSIKHEAFFPEVNFIAALVELDDENK